MVLLWLFPSFLVAQSPILEGYVATGLKSNLALQRQDLQVANAIQQLKQAKALYYPQISFNANYTVAAGGRAIEIPIGDLLNPVYETLNQMLAQDAFPQLDNVSEQFLPNNFHETKLNLVQPLFNSDIYFAHQARKFQVKVAEAKRMAYASELRNQIRVAYFRHLQAIEGEQIYLKGKEILQEVQRVNRSLVENQMRTKDVLSTVAAELAGLDGELAKARQQVTLSRSYFNFLLNRDLSAGIEIDELFLQQAPDTLVLATDLSVADRQELTAVKAGIEANRSLVEMQRYKGWLPEMYLAGQAGFQGFGYTFDGDQDYFLAQVGLTWNLFQGGKQKAALESARLELEGLENQFSELNQQLELQVVDAWQSCLASEAALEASEVALKAREDVFQLVQARYRTGKAILLELTQARNELTSAQLARSLSRFQLRIAYENLKQATAQS